MAVITIVPAQVLDSVGVSSGSRAWPGSLQSFKLTLLDANFTSPSDAVELTIDFSWDGGTTWPYHSVDNWVGGTKSRSGASPSVAIGPFMKNDAVNNPTHGRANIRATAGSPNVGLTLTT